MKPAENRVFFVWDETLDGSQYPCRAPLQYCLERRPICCLSHPDLLPTKDGHTLRYAYQECDDDKASYREKFQVVWQIKKLHEAFFGSLDDLLICLVAQSIRIQITVGNINNDRSCNNAMIH